MLGINVLNICDCFSLHHISLEMEQLDRWIYSCHGEEKAAFPYISDALFSLLCGSEDSYISEGGPSAYN